MMAECPKNGRFRASRVNRICTGSLIVRRRYSSQLPRALLEVLRNGLSRNDISDIKIIGYEIQFSGNRNIVMNWKPLIAIGSGRIVLLQETNSHRLLVRWWMYRSWPVSIISWAMAGCFGAAIFFLRYSIGDTCLIVLAAIGWMEIQVRIVAGLSVRRFVRRCVRNAYSVLGPHSSSRR